MDQVTQRYHMLLTSLETATVLALQRAHSKQVHPSLAQEKIHTAQIHASSLGSQLGRAQLNDTPTQGYTHIAPISIPAAITIGMLKVLARTAIIDAYRESTIAVYAANDVDGWVWVNDSGPCDWCLSMNGTVHLLTEKFESHNNCRCTTMPSM